MICDTPEQKNFILDCVRKYPTSYEIALQCANNFGQSIQDAQIIPIKDQLEKFPPPAALPVAPVNQKDIKAVSGNGKGGKKGKEVAK